MKKITVTQDDIIDGLAADSRWCPVARAVRRALNITEYSGLGVTLSYIRIDGGSERDVFYHMPKRVAQFIRDFDDGKLTQVRPITFALRRNNKRNT